MANELIGKRVGGCDITGVIGRGGMAIVYRAHQVSMNRPVAIKMLPRQFVEDPLYMQRFEREVRIVAQLEHRNIVPVHDYGEYEGQPFIVMRLMDGGSVDDLIRKQRRLTVDQVRDIITQIAPALDYAHAKGVLHRDLKPSNILLDDDGGAYLSDFGIARIMNETPTEAASPLTVTGVIGTPSYMSPEQAQGKPLDGRSDVYSLGICLFEMVTGVRPFDGETPYSIAVKQVTETPPAPRTLNPLLSPPVETVILRAMRKHAVDRYPNTVALAEALTTAIALPPVDPLLDTAPNPAMIAPTSVIDDPLRTQYRVRPNTPPGMTGIAPAPVTPPPAGFTPASAFTPPPSVAVPRVRRAGGGLAASVIVGIILGCIVLSLLAGAGVILLNLTAATTTPSPTPTADTTAVPSATRPGAAALPTRTAAGAMPTSAPVGARPSPTGIPGLGRIIFCSERDGHFDLYLLDLATRLETRLTNDPGNDMFAAPSPDGSRIAFQSDRDGDFDIYLMRADGSDVQRVTDNDVTDRQPVWSADGRAIYFTSDTRGDGAHDLYRIELDSGSGGIGLTYSDGGRISQPRVSPDGTALVFTTGRPDNAATWDIKRIDQTTGQVSFLSEATGKQFGASFTPDGGLLYLTEGLGYSAIWRMDGDGENAVVVYDGAGYENNPMAHPTEPVILFSSDVSGRDELYIMNDDGENIRQITESGASSGAWMP